jgi:hypothetical protein
MHHLRVASRAALAGLALLTGCQSCCDPCCGSQPGLFDRLRMRCCGTSSCGCASPINATPVSTGLGAPGCCGDGPFLGTPAPGVAGPPITLEPPALPPGPPPMPPAAGPTPLPPGTLPAPLAPVPNGGPLAQPIPATPSSRVRAG